MQIQFLGAADTVTGSKHLIEAAGQRILLDCGLFQGFKCFRERNWAPLAVDPRSIDAVVLSHAHLDHSGYLPVLARRASPDRCTHAGHARAVRGAADGQRTPAGGGRAPRQPLPHSRHAKALPLYTRADVKRVMARFRSLAPGREAPIGSVRVQLTPVGHLLGASVVSLTERDDSLVFSGDLGRRDDLLMPPPSPAPRADVMIVESTYGNRRHPAGDRRRC